MSQGLDSTALAEIQYQYQGSQPPVNPVPEEAALLASMGYAYVYKCTNTHTFSHTTLHTHTHIHNTLTHTYTLNFIQQVS